MSTEPFDFDAASLALLDGCAHLRALIAGANLVDAQDLSDHVDRQQAAEQLAHIVEQTTALTAGLQLRDAVTDAWQRDCRPPQPSKVTARIAGLHTDPGTYVNSYLLVDCLQGYVRIRGIDDDEPAFEETIFWLILSLEDSAELVRHIVETSW